MGGRGSAGRVREETGTQSRRVDEDREGRDTKDRGKTGQNWSGKGTEGVGVLNVPERRRTGDREPAKKRGQDTQAPTGPPKRGTDGNRVGWTNQGNTLEGGEGGLHRAGPV